MRFCAFTRRCKTPAGGQRVEAYYHGPMCSHYQSITELQVYRESFDVGFPARPPRALRHDIWPGYESTFIRRPVEADSGDDAAPAREVLVGIFGLVPHWAKDTKIAKRCFNARSETAAAKPSFRDAWRWGRRCIIPAAAFFEPDWRSGKAVPTRISRADGRPLGLAGLWSLWKGPEAQLVNSFTLLTVNAKDDPLMSRFHKPGDEKRSVVVLPEDRYEEWLTASPAASRALLMPCRADLLVAAPQLPG